MHVPHSCPPSGSVLSVDSRPLAGAVVTPVLGGGGVSHPSWLFVPAALLQRLGPLACGLCGVV